MTLYLNWRGPNGLETVDEFTRGSDNAPAGIREFFKYVGNMIEEYNLAGMYVYRSKRPCKAWKSAE